MANRIHDAFDNIKAQPQVVESTMQFIAKKCEKETQPIHNRAFQRAFLAVCIVFVLVAGIGSYTWLQAPISYVSIDVNPSIELALNRFDRVISTVAYNVEGEEVLKSLSLKGKRYTEAIDLIVESETMDAYLTDESEIVFAVAATGSRIKELKSGVESCSNHIGHKSQSISADMGIVSQAHENRFSLGKYYTYLQLIQYDDTVTVDECRDMSMSQIHGLINEHEHEKDEEHNQDTEHEKDEEHNQDTEHEYRNESSVDDNSTTSHHSDHHQEHK